MDEVERFEDTMRLYLTRQITRTEAEARTGTRWPELGEPRPLGEPDVQADWETLLDACVSDEERQAVTRARRAAGTHPLDRDTTKTILSVLERVTRRRV